jgi:pimeloyl-ACP methyl ester carboxylesterase
MTNLPYIEIGSRGGKRPTIVFVAGFPDNQQSGLGSTFRSKIEREFHTLYVCYPGFDDRSCGKPWGYSFDELVDMLHILITQSTEENEKVYLVGHDWGAYLSLKYENKYGAEKVQKLCLLDVGILSLGNCSFRQIASIFTYQSWLACIFLTSRIFGTLIAYFCSFTIFCYCAPLLVSLDHPVDVTHFARFMWYPGIVNKCYPYYQLWKGILTTGKVNAGRFPHSPLLFLVRIYYYILSIFLFLIILCSMELKKDICFMIKSLLTKLRKLTDANQLL